MKDKIKFIEKLAESMNENKIESVKYEDNDFEISLTKKKKERNVIFGSPIAQPAISSNISQEVQVQEEEVTAPVQQETPEEISGTKITSPMVGTLCFSIANSRTVCKGRRLCYRRANTLHS